ncbi:MAG: translation initiation factor IF-3 [Candidatus Xenolissoclinum pacificiensis L6]|uniref:Translation initiation factor IF-3 n=1 Tax=Candidatus Xenolissoclinum pacificiensis L6 TaxID=1401685 RepID=W2UZ21_9RICK|nr:MAG: translation initiation factor IF-3 [Candidatus Xenolissoclinum pacificiensis L6]
MRRFFLQNTNFKKNRDIVNENIRDYKVRVILGDNNEDLGVMITKEALKLAQSKGLDLLLIATPNNALSVCKVLDYGKYKYQKQKKDNIKKKNQKLSLIKEMKIRHSIGQADYDTKLKKMQNFLSEGHKVKITMRFKGRENAHSYLGLEMFRKISHDLQEVARVDKEPEKMGNQITMILSEKK